jgi:hypothetical protein
MSQDSSKKASPAVRRYDRPGHLDPAHAKRLLEIGEENHTRDPDRAFVGAQPTDDLAEELGKEAVTAMNEGGDELAEARDQTTVEELGGPFVNTTGAQEFADGVDASNPSTAEREPFPTT